MVRKSLCSPTPDIRGVKQCEELANVEAEWAIAMRPRKLWKLKTYPRKNKAVIAVERLKSSIRAKLEHPFRVIKYQFGFVRAGAVQEATQERQPTGDVVYAGEAVSSGPDDTGME